MTSWPSSIVSFPTLVNGVDYVLAEHQNTKADEIEAIETFLAYTSLTAEFANVETLSADKILTNADTTIQSYDLSANYSVSLPGNGTGNHSFFFWNRSANYTLTVKDNVGNVIATIKAGKGKIIISDGTTGVVDLLSPYLPTWISPTLLNSWVNYGAGNYEAGYWKDSQGWVHLRGTIKSGVVPSTVFVLPAGYRPLNTIHLPASAGGGTIFTLSVMATGDINVPPNTSSAYVDLASICFYADN